jgi:hypothetical protein
MIASSAFVACAPGELKKALIRGSASVEDVTVVITPEKAVLAPMRWCDSRPQPTDSGDELSLPTD